MMLSIAMLEFHQLAIHPCPFAMLYYGAVIPLGDDHGYHLHYYTTYDMFSKGG